MAKSAGMDETKVEYEYESTCIRLFFIRMNVTIVCESCMFVCLLLSRPSEKEAMGMQRNIPVVADYP